MWSVLKHMNMCLELIKVILEKNLNLISGCYMQLCKSKGDHGLSELE